MDRKVGGVFGGLAEFLGIDATLLRLIYIIITIITMKTGIAIIAYIVALFVIPSSDTSNEEVLERHRRRVEEKRNRHLGRNQARQEVREAMRNSHHHRRPRPENAEPIHHGARKKEARLVQYENSILIMRLSVPLLLEWRPGTLLSVLGTKNK